jgi:hypothetical protein
MRRLLALATSATAIFVYGCGKGNRTDNVGDYSLLNLARDEKIRRMFVVGPGKTPITIGDGSVHMTAEGLVDSSWILLPATANPDIGPFTGIQSTFATGISEVDLIKLGQRPITPLCGGTSNLKCTSVEVDFDLGTTMHGSFSFAEDISGQLTITVTGTPFSPFGRDQLTLVEPNGVHAKISQVLINGGTPPTGSTTKTPNAVRVRISQLP